METRGEVKVKLRIWESYSRVLEVSNLLKREIGKCIDSSRFPAQGWGSHEAEEEMLTHSSTMSLEE